MQFFNSAFKEGNSLDKQARGEYFRPVNTVKAPLVILLHGVGDHSLLPCHLLAKTLTRKGFACFKPIPACAYQPYVS